MNEYRLEQLFDLQMGKTPSRNESSYWLNGLHDWISIRDLSNSSKYISETNEKLSDIAVKESGIRIIPKDTVIMSFKLSIGKVAITSHDMYSNEAIMAFHDKKVVEILPEYLYYLLLAKNWDEGSNKAVMGITLNKATLSMIKIRMHDIVNQVQITSVLDNLDKQINNKKKQITEYDQLIKSRFVEMFGNVNKNSNKFLQDRLLNHLNVLGGYAFDSKKYIDEGIPILRIGNINTGIFIPKELKYWKYDANLDRYLIKPRDLLITLTGTVGKDDYGNVCIIDNTFPYYYLNQRNAKLDVFDTLNPIYLKYLLADSEIKSRLTGISRGVRQANIANRDILNLTVPIPPIELQNEFASLVQQVDKLKFEVQKSLSETQMLFDALMQEYFG